MAADVTPPQVLLWREGAPHSREAPDHPAESGPLYTWRETPEVLVLRASTQRGLPPSALKLLARPSSVEVRPVMRVPRGRRPRPRPVMRALDTAPSPERVHASVSCWPSMSAVRSAAPVDAMPSAVLRARGLSQAHVNGTHS